MARNSQKAIQPIVELYIATMKREEELVQQYLRSCGYTDIQHEPDGNIPPDFLVEKNIAIEVRRLNKNIATDKGKSGLEETSIPLAYKVQNHLKSFGPPREGKGWYVHYNFKRPIPSWDMLKTGFDKIFLICQKTLNNVPEKITLYDNFTVGLFPQSHPEMHFFELSDTMDEDSSGWLGDDLLSNLELCISEKSLKVRKYKHKYSEWWLALPDFVSYGSKKDLENLLPQTKLSLGLFAKVILINPIKPASAFVLCAW